MTQDNRPAQPEKRYAAAPPVNPYIPMDPAEYLSWLYALLLTKADKAIRPEETGKIAEGHNAKP